MRHGNKINHLGRTYGHRSAMLKNMAASLILHKRIETTLAKAKELRVFVEPIITRSKDNTTASRRTAFSYLQNKEAAKELFDVVGPKVGARPGGYTRIVKLVARLGDNASMAIIELVDFNETYAPKGAKSAEPKKKTRRGAVKKKAEEAQVVAEEPAAETPTEEKTEE